MPEEDQIGVDRPPWRNPDELARSQNRKPKIRAAVEYASKVLRHRVTKLNALGIRPDRKQDHH